MRGRIVRALAASRLRIGLVGLVGLAVVLGAAVGSGFLGTPAVEEVDNRFVGVDEESTTLETDLVVYNPNPFGVGGDLAVAYDVRMNGIEMASGGGQEIELGAGNTTLTFLTEMDNDRISAWWASHLQDDEETTVVVDAEVSSGVAGRTVAAPPVEHRIETNVSDAFDSTETRELEADREPLVQDPALYVNETRGDWGEVTETTTDVEMEFEVYNPQPYPIVIQEIRYDVAMNEITVGDGGTDQPQAIPPGETRTVEATTTIENGALDDWWVTHLERNQVTEMAVDFEFVVDFSETTDLADLQVALPVDTMTQPVETDVFGNKDQHPTGEEPEREDGDDADGERATDPAVLPAARSLPVV